MRTNCLTTLLLSCCTLSLHSQGLRDSLMSNRGSVLRIEPSVDIPVVAASAAWCLYNFAQIGKKESTSLAELQGLTTHDIGWLDRWAIHPYSKSIDQISYIPFFVAMPLPLAVFGIDKKMRKDFWKLTFLYGEAMTLTGVLYTTAVHYVSRHRPLVYESASPLETRQSANSRNSFFAGHVALVATSTFFIAQAYALYHPQSPYKWVVYGGAAVITDLTAYWRNRAGEHFFSDILVGNLIGSVSGMLIPLLHRGTRFHKVSVLPFSSQGVGMTALVRLP